MPAKTWILRALRVPRQLGAPNTEPNRLSNIVNNYTMPSDKFKLVAARTVALTIMQRIDRATRPEQRFYSA